jgi:hypothetical protein
MMVVEFSFSKFKNMWILVVEVLTVDMSLVVFWVVMPCGYIGLYQHFGGTYCLQLLG